MFGLLKKLFGAGNGRGMRNSVRQHRMGYVPRIASAVSIAKYQVAGRQAELFDKIVSAGMVQYQYVLAIYDADGEPSLFVASEVNTEREAFGGGSHFLGVFTGDGHGNLGSSDEWADRDAFVRRALQIAAGHFAT